MKSRRNFIGSQLRIIKSSVVSKKTIYEVLEECKPKERKIIIPILTIELDKFSDDDKWNCKKLSTTIMTTLHL
jgi:hypothetical protein